MPHVWHCGLPYRLCRGDPGVMFSKPKGQDWGIRDPQNWMLSESCPCTLALVLGSEVNTAAWLSLFVNSTQSNLSPSYALQVLHSNIVILQGTET